MPAIIPLVVGLAAAGASGYSASVSHQAGKKSANAQNDALQFQQESAASDAANAAKLEADTAAAPEKARQEELKKRRIRTKTLLSDQQDTGMATVGNKTLLGG